MIHHYKTPIIRQQRDVQPQYQSPSDPNYDSKNFGRPVGFKTSKTVRLTIDVDFEYPEENSGPVKIILEQLHALMCLSNAENMNYE